MKEEKKTEGVCLSGSLTDGSMIGMVVVSRDGRPFVERAAYHHPKTRGEVAETLESLTAEFDAPSSGRFMFTSSLGEVMLARQSEIGGDRTAGIEKLVRKRWPDWEDRVFAIHCSRPGRVPAEGEDLLIYSLPKGEFAAVTGPLAHLPDLVLAPAPVLAARILAGEKSLAEERVAILDLAAERTQITIAHGGAIVAERGVGTGLDTLFEAIQAKLELKFIGSAAKLFYDGIYDFSEVEDELLNGLAEKILPGLKELETVIGKPVGRILPINLAPETLWVERPLAKLFNRSLAALPADSLARFNADAGRLSDVAALQVVLAALARGDEIWNGIGLKADAAAGLKPALQGLEAAIAAAAPKEDKSKGKNAPAPAAKPAPAKAPEPAGARAAPQPAKPAQAAPQAAQPAKEAAKPAAPAKSEAASKPAATATPAKPAATAKPVAPAAAGTEKKKPMALIGGAAAAVVVAVILGFMFMGGDEPATPKTSSSSLPGFSPATRDKADPSAVDVAETESDTATEEGVSSAGSAETEATSLMQTVADADSSASDVSEEPSASEGASTDASALPDGASEVAEAAVEGAVESEAETEPEPEPEPEPTTGTLVVSSDPEGARVFLDDEEVGVTPLELPEIEAGDYVVRLEMDGYDPAEHMMTVVAGETAATEIPALRPEAADLRIVSTPEGVPFELRAVGAGPFESDTAEVAFEPVKGLTPLTMSNLPLGHYEIVYQREGWPELREEVALEKSREEVEAILEFPAGTLVVTSDPAGAEIYRDGQMIGVTPLRLEDLPPGNVEITALMENFSQETQTATVEVGNETTLNFELVDFDRIFIVSHVHTQPKPVTQVAPTRTPTVINVENVVVRCVIDKEGIPTDLEILSSSNTRFNPVVLETVAEWRFEPATYMDQPVKTLVTIPFVFRPDGR